MEEVVFRGNYIDFKTQMDIEIKEAAEGFVRIGYLLKVARDTNILAESGYQTVADFAKAEYGLTKDMVSRYIAINDKYAEGGYSDQLQERFKRFGVAKLAEMLTLPDEIVEEISPDMTKNEIRDIKKDYKEEQNISDLELLMEQQDGDEALSTNLEKMLYEYFRQPDKYKVFQETYTKALDITGGEADSIDRIFQSKDQMLDVIAPNGMENIRARVPGTGRMMLTVDEEDPVLTLTNMRTMEKETFRWEDLGEAFKKLHFYNPDWQMAYRALYGKAPEEEKEEVAPAQLPQKPINTEREKVKEAPAAAGEEQEEEVRVAAGEIVPKNNEIESENNEIVPENNENEEIVTENAEIVTENEEIVPKTDTEEKCQNCSYYGKSADAPESVPNDCMYVPGEDNNFSDKKPCEMNEEEAPPAAVHEEPEKVTGEVVENIDFTECDSPKGKRIWMIKNAIMEDIEKLRDQTQSEQWAGATLTVTDIELQLRQVKALLIEEESEDENIPDI